MNWSKLFNTAHLYTHTPYTHTQLKTHNRTLAAKRTPFPLQPCKSVLYQAVINENQNAPPPPISWPPFQHTVILYSTTRPYIYYRPPLTLAHSFSFDGITISPTPIPLYLLTDKKCLLRIEWNTCPRGPRRRCWIPCRALSQWRRSRMKATIVQLKSGTFQRHWPVHCVKATLSMQSGKLLF